MDRHSAAMKSLFLAAALAAITVPAIAQHAPRKTATTQSDMAVIRRGKLTP